MKGKDSKIRSLVKTLTWRVIATCITWAVGYALTRNLSGSLELSLIAAVLSTVVYYIHERVWTHLKWGKK
jgi:uncharacterized membrane protein